MSAHDYHDALLGYDPRQLLVDGCAECERRGKDVALSITSLDPPRFCRAWRRAYDLAASRGNHAAVGPVSSCEAPMLDALWAVQVQLERLGVPIDGRPAGVR